ncbi:hypothetical protein ACFELG_15440 [Pseudomonas aeruginosa]|uniref:hypothetical protein n=1 Tax=Pseudomonas aeruginosa TaxID=287 RepID=UPI00383AB465
MDELIERPLTFIRDKAGEFAEAKSNRVYLEQFRKSKKALLMLDAERNGVKTIVPRSRMPTHTMNIWSF